MRYHQKKGLTRHDDTKLSHIKYHTVVDFPFRFKIRTKIFKLDQPPPPPNS
jgi:hypothetical protein